MPIYYYVGQYSCTVASWESSTLKLNANSIIIRTQKKVSSKGRIFMNFVWPNLIQLIEALMHGRSNLWANTCTPAAFLVLEHSTVWLG